MIYSIFYDLETTDLERVGQILNFAFVVVDENFEEVDSFAAYVKISRLQLPRAGAILANKTNVLTHQQEATHTESEAIRDIDAFLRKWSSQNKENKLPIVGYNSDSFDYDYLRTSFIRNGRNPYLIGLVTRDLLLVARYLMAFNDDFRSKVFAYAKAEEGRKVNLKLESLSKLFGLLEGEQLHESLFDVRLTVKLAKTLSSLFGVDVREFEPYKVKELHKGKRGELFYLREPLSSRFKEEVRYKEYPATLLQTNHRYALWIDLEKFQVQQKGKKDLSKAIKWRKFASHLVSPSPDKVPTELAPLAEDALSKLATTNLDNFFTDTNCDIEQFIFRISPGEIDALYRAMTTNLIPSDVSTDFRQLARRYWLENTSDISSQEFNDAFNKYAKYRYGGELRLKSDSTEVEAGEGSESPKGVRHPTLKELLSELTSKSDEAQGADKELMLALKEFYLRSELHRVLSATDPVS